MYLLDRQRTLDGIAFFFGINADEEGSKCHHLFCMLHTSTIVSSKLTQIALGMFFSYHHLIKAARRQSWYYIKEKCFISLLITILVCIEGSNVPTTYLYQNMFYVLSYSLKTIMLAAATTTRQTFHSYVQGWDMYPTAWKDKNVSEYCNLYMFHSYHIR